MPLAVPLDVTVSAVLLPVGEPVPLAVPLDVTVSAVLLPVGEPVPDPVAVPLLETVGGGRKVLLPDGEPVLLAVPLDVTEPVAEPVRVGKKLFVADVDVVGEPVAVPLLVACAEATKVLLPVCEPVPLFVPLDVTEPVADPVGIGTKLLVPETDVVGVPVLLAVALREGTNVCELEVVPVPLPDAVIEGR